MTFSKKHTPRSLLLFYILVTYVLLQFTWWSYLLVELNKEVYSLKQTIALLQSTGASQKVNLEKLKEEAKKLKAALDKKKMMIAGEGTVFLVLLVVGIYKVRSTFKKESALSKQQNNFLLSVTHELKSPLASAKLQLQTLQKRELARDQQQIILEHALSDVERFHGLVENILLVAQIDNSSSFAHLEKTNISNIITDITKKYALLLQHQCIIQQSIEPNITLNADPIYFPSILINLIENAAKYSPKGSSIKIEWKSVGGQFAILSVTDEGPGIPDEEKQQVFKKFYRVGNEDTRKTKGTGLGLFIVGSLVHEHRGKIQIKNNQPKGSIFEIIFPYEPR